ncbi:hypothetical protein L873DRAFT_192079 [Choiromyces venosus 120613-1]|uniref:Secreted protein n=1 Tax=Choiromyces venosus 120613-1 TaxID=1336337 RepID=A0A3N4J7I4_9PEZI|nr:hypothetical protein L873DRAFT_192079 [Choiromyces venosus 120613-1]
MYILCSHIFNIYRFLLLTLFPQLSNAGACRLSRYYKYQRITSILHTFHHYSETRTRPMTDTCVPVLCKNHLIPLLGVVALGMGNTCTLRPQFYAYPRWRDTQPLKGFALCVFPSPRCFSHLGLPPYS